MIDLLLAATICAKLANFTPPETCPDDPENLCLVTLAEKYANQRNFDAAAYFLCQAEDSISQAEFEGMMEHVQNMRAGKETRPLDFCDHSTSTAGGMFCAHKAWEEAMPKLDARLTALRVSDALRVRSNAFAALDSERMAEENLGGTGYMAIALGAEVEAKEAIVAAIEQWSKKRAPAVSEAEAKRADSALNAAYKKLEKTEPLRDAQRAWIAWRDAFANYYVARWKGAAAPDALRREIVAQLTRDRTATLRNAPAG
jgi:uncharacterized protein YecT (DUF1311 family)